MYKNNKEGGKVLASGGFGCVFTPALKCEGSTSRSREKNKISKPCHLRKLRVLSPNLFLNKVAYLD